jgi:hypothetical protein
MVTSLLASSSEIEGWKMEVFALQVSSLVILEGDLLVSLKEDLEGDKQLKGICKGVS